MILLPETCFRLVTEHASAAYPEECCGVLLGHREHGHRAVLEVVRCRNVHPAPATRYALDPAELITIQRGARERGLEIVGFYHSHPDRPSYASPTDLAEAHWMDCSYIIASVEKGSVAQVRSFRLDPIGDDKQLLEEPLKVVYAEISILDPRYPYAPLGRRPKLDLS